ncbi:MAG TPA: hypothetical protein VEU30_10815 [Thermoanaerobaculia bacterium]|nr:hypothetical protein [Thermoanaerobaculia bacterium]
MKTLAWVLTAALAAWACELAAHHATPVDQALWLIAICVVALAWTAEMPAMLVAVPMLVGVEIAMADEGLRLLLFGAIVAVAFGTPASRRLVRRRPAGVPGTAARDAAAPAGGDAGVPIAAIILLRWIPVEDVLWFREVLLLVVCIAIVQVLGRTPFAAAIGVLTALVTPAVPLRTLALPLLVLGIAVLARRFGMPTLRLTAPSVAIVAFVMLFFPWSGITARAFPYFLKRAQPQRAAQWIGEALTPNQTLTLTVPEHATHLIVSGANVPRLKSGALLGTLDGRAIRIGDASDWGYMRRDHFFGARNPLPRDPAGRIRDYGYAAWVDGAGRVALPRGARTIRVTADPSLPKDASLQVEAFELATR